MKKVFKIFFSVALIFAVALGWSIWQSANVLTVTEYNISTDKINCNFKIVLISDLHNKKFGKENKQLVNLIEKQNPDFIAVCGDMVTGFEDEKRPVLKLLPQLKKIAPVYYALGNHEREYEDFEELTADIKATGTSLLDNEMTTVDIDNSESIVIGGLTDFPYYDSDTPDFNNERRYFLDSFEDKTAKKYTILLAHQPEFFFWTYGLKEKDIDLVLSGHTHGGVVQIPFIGGLYAPNQGWFPQYDKGYFSSDTSNMIITSGLGNDVFVPRINNQPEVCVININ